MSFIANAVDGLGRREDVSSGQEYMEQVLRTAVDDVYKKVAGLSLSCVRNGTYSEKDGECHSGGKCNCLSKDST